ncbi:hypothetical protein CANCADRAFT_106911 [Tortispora caseinolytica NRRL Y-17796]|uniref:Dystroglycan-type cadherin-like domain-containing protein n=1 Tax=Tortispora caseinolytica NRRL Y-17796 TaxID=767744 RepID=A0A1E4TFN2_9ASCO|nr:hypothetical protein CANCADRAFT_106911 [Tortispora caseinolytica NRRL Y-17796]
MIISHTHIYILLVLAAQTLATVSLSYAFNSQLPLIARPSEPYEFVIASSTYQTDASDLVYGLSGGPDWLNFDNTTLTLSGTPPSIDVANETIVFGLTGSDSAGGFLNSTSYIILSASKAPAVRDSVSNQLHTFGNTDGSNGLVYNPGEDFSIYFSTDTFGQPSSAQDSSLPIVDYYGISSDNTPLPPWIKFDSENLTFTGTTPQVNSDIAPAERYGFKLIATDIRGFSAVYQTFYLAIGAHSLYVNLSDAQITVNATARDHFSYEIPLSSFVLDGKQIEAANISKMTCNATGWLSFDESTFTLSGIPETASDSQTNIQVTLYDTFGDTASLSLNVQVIGSIFLSPIPTWNVTAGTAVNYTLPDSILAQSSSDVEITAAFSPSNLGDWLTYDQNTRTFSGTVPSDFTSATITLTAKSGDNSDTTEFTIQSTTTFATTTSSSVSPTATGTTSSTASAFPTAATDNEDGGSSSKTVAIACGVAIPLAVIAIAALVFFFCCRRRRQKTDEENYGDGYASKAASPYGPPTFPDPDDEGDLMYEKKFGENDSNRFSSIDMFQVGDDGKVYSMMDTSIPSHRLSMNGLVNSDSQNGISGSAAAAAAAAGIVASGPVPDPRGPPGHSQPRRSWRDTTTSSNYDGNNNNRDSMNSLATVATNELFSVRLVDDGEEGVDSRRSSGNFVPAGGPGRSRSSIMKLNKPFDGIQEEDEEQDITMGSSSYGRPTDSTFGSQAFTAQPGFSSEGASSDGEQNEEWATEESSAFDDYQSIGTYTTSASDDVTRQGQAIPTFDTVSDSLHHSNSRGTNSTTRTSGVFEVMTGEDGEAVWRRRESDFETPRAPHADWNAGSVHSQTFASPGASTLVGAGVEVSPLPRSINSFTRRTSETADNIHVDDRSIDRAQLVDPEIRGRTSHDSPSHDKFRRSISAEMAFI